MNYFQREWSPHGVHPFFNGEHFCVRSQNQGCCAPQVGAAISAWIIMSLIDCWKSIGYVSIKDNMEFRQIWYKSLIENNDIAVWQIQSILRMFLCLASILFYSIPNLTLKLFLRFFLFWKSVKRRWLKCNQCKCIASSILIDPPRFDLKYKNFNRFYDCRHTFLLLRKLLADCQELFILHSPWWHNFSSLNSVYSKAKLTQNNWCFS